MTAISAARPRRLLHLVVAAFVFVSVSALCAGSRLMPKHETMTINYVPVDVDYQSPIPDDELKLPLYPDARTETSFRYNIVTSQDEKPVLFYASAVLLTPDDPKAVAEYYSSHLPGNPQPETLQDKEGKRVVLGVGDSHEVRTVTITAEKTGSRIQLMQTTEPAVLKGTPPEPPQIAPSPALRGRRGGRAKA